MTMWRAGLALIGAVLLTPALARAEDQSKQFLEFEDGNDIQIYDLRTVRIIQPGKFAIIYSIVGKPENIRFELKVLDVLRTHCARLDGDYPPPTEILTLGSADMPVKNIVVKSVGKAKHVRWSYPYSKITIGEQQQPTIFRCRTSSSDSDAQEYFEARALITNGYRAMDIYDCKRALEAHMGPSALDLGNDPVKEPMSPVGKGTSAAHLYKAICLAVTHEAPYEP